MPRRNASVFFASFALSIFPAALRADKTADVLTTNHLAAGTTAYVIADETTVLDDMKALQKDKKKVDEDNRTRKQLSAKVANSKQTIEQSRKEYTSLQDRLTVVKDVAIHNRMVSRMNMLALKAKEASEAQKDAEDKENQISIEPETKYVDELLALETKADAAAEKYTSLAANAAVKSAVAASPAHLPLGPSKEFADALVEIKKWRAEIESEAIPLTESGGVQMVTALLNGEQETLVLDPGASLVTLPGEMAEALKITVSPQDEVIQLKLADGNVIQGHRVSLKNVRLGRFTIDNVSCVVLAKGLHDAPALLGNSFLSHFIVKIDQKAGQLHLVEVGKSETSAGKPAAATGTDHVPSGKIDVK